MQALDIYSSETKFRHGIAGCGRCSNAHGSYSSYFGPLMAPGRFIMQIINHGRNLCNNMEGSRFLREEAIDLQRRTGLVYKKKNGKLRLLSMFFQLMAKCRLFRLKMAQGIEQ